MEYYLQGEEATESIIDDVKQLEEVARVIEEENVVNRVFALEGSEDGPHSSRVEDAVDNQLDQRQ